MKPPRSILDKAFKWTPSHQTDISKRFAKIYRERRENQQELDRKLHRIQDKVKVA